MRHSLHLRLVGVAVTVVLAAFAVQGFGTAPAGATSPGANGRIAFARTHAQANPDIYSISAAGKGIKKLVTEGWDPSWSPDGSMLAFMSYRSPDGANAVWVMNADGSGLRQLTHPVQGQEVDAGPTWSPDGSSLAFIRMGGDGLDSNLWIVNADGTGVRQLTTDNLAADPAWAPSGIQIAFTDYVGTDRIDSNVAVIKADGTGLHGVGGGPSMDYTGPAAPSWSPDGASIAFDMSHRGSGTDDIWVMGSDGTGARPLTHKQDADDVAPSWSPDGTMIAFSSDRTDSYKIWTIGADGHGAHQVTWLSSVEDYAPNWRTIPQ